MSNTSFILHCPACLFRMDEEILELTYENLTSYCPACTYDTTGTKAHTCTDQYHYDSALFLAIEEIKHEHGLTVDTFEIYNRLNELYPF